MANLGSQRNSAEGWGIVSWPCSAGLGCCAAVKYALWRYAIVIAEGGGPTPCDALFLRRGERQDESVRPARERVVLRAKDLSRCAWSAIALLEFDR